MRTPPRAGVLLGAALLGSACAEATPRIVDLRWAALRAGDAGLDAVNEPIIEGGRGQILVEGRIPVGGYCPAIVPRMEQSGRAVRVTVEVRPAGPESGGGAPSWPCAEPDGIRGVVYAIAVAGVPRGILDVEVRQRVPAPRDPRTVTAETFHRHMVAVQ